VAPSQNVLVIDNASQEPLAGNWDLSWHDRSRHVREDELGTTIARLRGIKESKGELLLFVDDDNVLAADYLEQALKIGRSFEFIGVWGACINPEFEIEPPAWTRRFWSYLALRPIERSFWANMVTDYSLLPAGAGFCIRRKVAEAYARNDAQARQIGRRGNVLTSCEDTDLVLTGCDLGYGYGCFVELRLLHLIHKGRLAEDYLLRLVEGCTLSTSLLQARRNGALPPSPSKPWWRRKLGAFRRRLMMKRMDRLILEARMRGWEQAKAVISQTSSTVPGGPQQKPDMSYVPWRS